MNPYETYTKAQLIEVLNDIERVLESSRQDANTASKGYSTELTSQLAFEIGHLGGSVKTVLEYIKEAKGI